MYIAITSNLKKYYKGYIDFIDHYWLNFFENQKIEYSLIPNKPYLSIKKFFSCLSFNYLSSNLVKYLY